VIYLNEVISSIEGKLETVNLNPESIEIEGGYVSDLLSDVMGNALKNQVWITIMKHLNVIAVASLAGIPAIIFSKNSTPDQTVIQKAEEEGIALISSPLSTFKIAGILYSLFT